MANIKDQDRFFIGALKATTPKHLIGEGELVRLLNARFIEGAITNAIGFDEIELTFDEDAYISGTTVKYSDLLKQGDVQLLAPLSNIAGKFLVFVISGILFQLDLETNAIADITPFNSFLTDESNTPYPLTYIDNDGGVYGVGGYLVIFNYPNRPIFVNHIEARLSDESEYETPVSRLGVTAANRAFVVSGNNIMYASDPLGNYDSLAPLTFIETLKPGEPYFDQTFTVGSTLDLDKITAVCRVPQLLGAAQDFLGQNVLVSTTNKKYLIAVSNPRDDWESIQFINYAGTSEGIAGQHACTNIGSAVVYTSYTGRIKTFYQDQERETSMSESYFDESLGQYACCYESDFYFRPWYRNLKHRFSEVKFSKDRLYCSVYPIPTPALNKYREEVTCYSHKALAVGALSSDAQIGPQASITWEGFYDWINPCKMTVLDNDFYILAKNKYGRISLYKENYNKRDEHTSVIYTRGYFSNADGRSRSLSEVVLHFRKLGGNIGVNISYLADGEWICAIQCQSDKKTMVFKLSANKCKSNSASIPLKIELEHNGCLFELEGIRVEGEVYPKEK